MQHKFFRFHKLTFTWRGLFTEEIIAILLVLLLFAAPSQALRLQERSLYMKSTLPGATTSYTVAFKYMSPQVVGSVDLLFCNDPIPYHSCVKPAGLDVSNAALTEQLGEIGYSISTRSANHLVLTRAPGMISSTTSSYTFGNIVNPTDESEAFSIRLRTHASTNATGPQIDFGSVRGQVSEGVVLETQVPPMLIFCVAEQVEENCTSTNDNYYTDMGELNHTSTLTAQSQMAVGTNATAGFAITANGGSMSAGTNVIDTPSSPTESKQGTNQFGINLVANNAPTVGSDPEGTWANAVASADYSIANRYKYVPGDVIAYSPNVSLMKKFTVSYIVNANQNLKPGVYTTTINYVATGRF